MKIRWTNCGGIPLPIVSRWGLNKGARYSPKAPTVGTLQTLPEIEDPISGSAGQAVGFSLHAGVATKANQRDKLERLCRYITRPAVSEKRLSLTNQGKGSKSRLAEGRDEKTPVQRYVAMTWAQRLKRVFKIDVETCRVCGGVITESGV